MEITRDEGVIFDNGRQPVEEKPTPENSKSLILFSSQTPVISIKPANNRSKPKDNSPSNLTPAIKELLKDYKLVVTKPKKEGATIHVDEIASKIARLYEQIRQVVDWKQENVLRRSAILRILKRSLIAKISSLTTTISIDIDYVAESLILELIRGGHLPNDEIPVEQIKVIGRVLKKYIFILENAPFTQNKEKFLLKKKVNFYNWLLEIAACEIEDILAPPQKENGLIKAMTLSMNERIRLVPNNLLTESEKRTLTYIAVCRTLFDLDDSYISFHILKYQYPDWNNPSEETTIKFASQIFNIAERIEKCLTHPLSRDFFNLCEKNDTVFTLLGDILDYYKKSPAKIPLVLADKRYFRKLIINFYNKRLKTLKTRLFRLAILSTLSVFVSNWFTYFIVEVPLAHLFYEGFNFWSAVVDFILPSLAMFILVAIIKPPGPGNLDKVIEASFNFVYQDQPKEIYEIKKQKKRRFFFNLIIGFFYLAAAVIFFGTVAWVFYIANIPITSVIFDTLTIAINVFAALVVRNKAKELTIKEKPSISEFFLDVLSLPVARVGNFLANKWKEYNVISVFFNYFIEMPLITFIEFVESWREFLKQEKADIH